MQNVSFLKAQSSTSCNISSIPYSDSQLNEALCFGIIEADSNILLDRALERYFIEDASNNRLVLIVCPANSPIDDRRKEPPIHSFLATSALYNKARLSEFSPDLWCFQVLKWALSGSKTEVDIQVVHKVVGDPVTRASGSCETTISHRGPERYLRNCVHSLLQQSYPTKITIGIDQKYECGRFLDDVKGNKFVQTYQIRPNPVGLYVVLHVLGNQSCADFIARQDSDDVSLRRRLSTLIDAANRTGCGIVGSHELQLHEVERQVIPVRYPADVNKALTIAGAGHQALLPMTIVRRDVFGRVGGFSTNRIFSLDVNFWLLASLHTKIINVDEFLYIRRRHSSSLTMRDDIGMFSPVRIKYRIERESHFNSIISGDMKLEDSSLAISHRRDPVYFRNTDSGTVTEIFLDRPETFAAMTLSVL
jgi:hypothetical protein